MWEHAGYVRPSQHFALCCCRGARGLRCAVIDPLPEHAAFVQIPICNRPGDRNHAERMRMVRLRQAQGHRLSHSGPGPGPVRRGRLRSRAAGPVSGWNTVARTVDLRRESRRQVPRKAARSHVVRDPESRCILHGRAHRPGRRGNGRRYWRHQNPGWRDIMLSGESRLSNEFSSSILVHKHCKR